MLSDLMRVSRQKFLEFKMQQIGQIMKYYHKYK